VIRRACSFLKNRKKKRWTMMKTIRKLFSLFLALGMLLSLSAYGFSEENTDGENVAAAEANSMRLMRAEGNVTLTDGTGAVIAIRETMRLYSGNAVSTETESRAGISLDDTKAVTVGENSSVSLRQDGKKLELDLESGAMYFSIAKPLEAEESFTIRTSDMLLGIRGTAGQVEKTGETETAVILASGHALISAATGEEQAIRAGQRVVITQSASGAQFTVSEITPEEYPDLLLEELAFDERLLAEAAAQNGKGFREAVLVSLLERAIEKGDLPLIAKAYNGKTGFVHAGGEEPKPNDSDGGGSDSGQNDGKVVVRNGSPAFAGNNG
jgi:ferric-dicitrate binding protein FerR (iron transport regulator)